MNTLTINGREFKVEPNGRTYMLYGPRNAVYGAIPAMAANGRELEQHVFHIVNSFTGKAPTGLGSVVLTDANGTLEVR